MSRGGGGGARRVRRFRCAGRERGRSWRSEEGFVVWVVKLLWFCTTGITGQLSRLWWLLKVTGTDFQQILTKKRVLQTEVAKIIFMIIFSRLTIK